MRKPPVWYPLQLEVATKLNRFVNFDTTKNLSNCILQKDATMKHFILTILFVFSGLLLMSQESIHTTYDSIKKIIDRLKNEVEIKSDSILLLEPRFKKLEFEVFMQELKSPDNDYPFYIPASTTPIIIYSSGKAKLRKEGVGTADVIRYIDQNTPITLLDYANNYWLISYESDIGYMNEMYIQQSDEIQLIIDATDKDKRFKYEEDLVIANKKKVAEKKALMIQLYGSEIAAKIMKQQYWIGMTDIMAEHSIGRPDDINRTVNSRGVREQWVYNRYDIYLYFEDGKLTSYQNTR